MSASLIRCRDCALWDNGEDPEAGLCRLLAPQPRLAGQGGQQDLSEHVVWPITYAADGCGEGRER